MEIKRSKNKTKKKDTKNRTSFLFTRTCVFSFNSLEIPHYLCLFCVCFFGIFSTRSKWFVVYFLLLFFYAFLLNNFENPQDEKPVQREEDVFKQTFLAKKKFYTCGWVKTQLFLWKVSWEYARKKTKPARQREICLCARLQKRSLFLRTSFLVVVARSLLFRSVFVFLVWTFALYLFSEKLKNQKFIKHTKNE